jgi:hypothetical protein
MTHEPTLEERIQLMLEMPADRDEVERVLVDGYAHALRLDAERLALERQITVLAARAEDEEAAQGLRRAWLRHRTLNRELQELREMLRRLKEA